jgi:hypothetical protein
MEAVKKTYTTYNSLVKAAEKEGYYLVNPATHAYSIGLYKAGCHTLIYLKAGKGWVRA